MQVVWLVHAEHDRLLQLDWYAEYSVDAAERMARRIIAQTRLLAAFPGMGRNGTAAGTYHLIVPRTPFLLVYSITDSVNILRLLHVAQDWPGRF